MKIKILIGIFLSAALTGILIFNSFLSEKNADKLNINDREFEVEAVYSSKDMERGLAGRKDICENCGMLFIFPQKGKHSFWMKGMNFNLDMIWILEGRIVFIAKNVSRDFMGTINPEVEADKVLEIKGGTSDKYGFMVGMEVK